MFRSRSATISVNSAAACGRQNWVADQVSHGPISKALARRVKLWHCLVSQGRSFFAQSAPCQLTWLWSLAIARPSRMSAFESRSFGFGPLPKEIER